MNKFGFYPVLIAMAFCLIGPGIATAQQGSAPVEADAVRMEPLSQTFPVLGRMVARQTGVVAALTRGPVAEVLVDVGDRVREGDVLARLATDRLEQAKATRTADLSERRAALGTAQAQLELAREEMARLEKLKGSAAFSRARYNDKRREVAVAKAAIGEANAAIARARSELAVAEIDLSLAVVKAPYSGVVTAKYIERGAYVNVGDRALALINDLDLEVEADVPSNRLDGLTPGRTVDAELAKGETVTATVRALVPQENALTRTRLVRFIPDLGHVSSDDNGGLAAGQTVTLLIPVGEVSDVLTVHKDAVLPRGDTNMVFLVKDGTAIPRPVQLGSATGQRFVVVSGLEAGDLVVIRGNERLRPNQPVRIQGSEG